MAFIYHPFSAHEISSDVHSFHSDIGKLCLLIFFLARKRLASLIGLCKEPAFGVIDLCYVSPAFNFIVFCSDFYDVLPSVYFRLKLVSFPTFLRLLILDHSSPVCEYML